eukprot:m.766769 g.766769  ORF g.766769 m.766769 type:complete len:1289 (-) comp59065_c0_seq41:1665-5531(-)
MAEEESFSARQQPALEPVVSPSPPTLQASPLVAQEPTLDTAHLVDDGSPPRARPGSAARTSTSQHLARTASQASGTVQPATAASTSVSKTASASSGTHAPSTSRPSSASGFAQPAAVSKSASAASNPLLANTGSSTPGRSSTPPRSGTPPTTKPAELGSSSSPASASRPSSAGPVAQPAAASRTGSATSQKATPTNLSSSSLRKSETLSVQFAAEPEVRVWDLEPDAEQPAVLPFALSEAMETLATTSAFLKNMSVIPPTQPTTTVADAVYAPPTYSDGTPVPQVPVRPTTAQQRVGQDGIEQLFLEFPTVDEIFAEIDRENEKGADSWVPSSTGRPGTADGIDPVRQNISQLVHEVQQETIPGYLDEFDQDIADHKLLIGSVPLEEVQREERRIRENRVQAQLDEAKRQRELEALIVTKTEKAKRAVAQDFDQKQRRIQAHQSDLRQKDRMRLQEMHKAFHKAEVQLLDVLERNKADVQATYGDLILAEGNYSGSNARRWKVNWDRAPQPLQIKLRGIRGVRDKLPRGQYIVVVSLYDRLGGRLMRWSRLKGSEWHGATLTCDYFGRFSDEELAINQSVFSVCPPRKSIRAGMAVTFELYLLRGEASPVDRVVAWGVFPIVNSDFNVISGKFKAPLARGILNTRLTMFSKIEQYFAADIDNWLGNLYFEVIKLPRYTAGQKEYEVELQYTSGLLGFPERSADPDDAEDMRNEAALVARSFDDELPSPDSSVQRPIPGINAQIRRRMSSRLSQSRLRRLSSARPQTSLNQSDDDDSDHNSEEEDEVESRRVEEAPGLSYTIRTNKIDEYQKRLYRLRPKSTLGLQRKPRTKQEELDQHSTSVVPVYLDRVRQRGHEKVEYMLSQLVSELGLAQVRTREFWANVFMLILCFWIRLYAHYFGQWLFLQAVKMPISDFTFEPVWVNLNYQATLTLTREEIGVVVCGPLMVLVIFALLSGAAYLSRTVLGSFNTLASVFTFAWGWNAVLDPVLIGLVDLSLERWRVDDQNSRPIGDMFKLYWHFQRSDNSGLPGVFLTLFLYALLMFAGMVMFYVYFLKWHMNGRLLDIYQRLNSTDEDLFTPYDFEISNKELGTIVKKAEQWRGKQGERRKVAVYDYVWEESEEDAAPPPISSKKGKKAAEPTKRQEKTVHISIHTLYLDGTRELYRHFLRLPDGAILEVLGDATALSSERGLSQALNKTHVNLKKLIQSSTTYINETLQGEGELARGTISRGVADSSDPLPDRPLISTSFTDFGMRPRSVAGKNRLAMPSSARSSRSASTIRHLPTPSSL